MNKKLIKIFKMVSIGSLLSSYPIHSASAMADEVSNTSNIDHNDFTLELIRGDNDTSLVQGTLEKSNNYRLVLDNTDTYVFETNEEGFYSLQITNDKFKTYHIVNELDEVILEGVMNTKEEDLVIPVVNPIKSGDTFISGFNKEGNIIFIYLNDVLNIEQEIQIDADYSISLEEPLEAGTKITIYVENELGNSSEKVIVNVPDSEENATLDIEETEVKTKENSEGSEEQQVINETKQFSTFSTRIVQNQPDGKTYHFVQSGETLYSLANVYNTTVSQLLMWNELSDASMLRSGTLISVDGKNVYEDIAKETTQFPNNQAFLNYITPYAKKISKEYNLYTSIMIAQALHESNWGRSNLAKMGNNLFGVKGSYNGNSVVMLTWEELPNGEVIWIQDRFRLYPTYYESIIDNAEKLRYGVSWDPNYYSGAWVENTASHMDATEWLTGRYATDSKYNVKVNNTIKTHNLLRHDEHISITNPIISQQKINRETYVTNDSKPIYSEPYGTASYKQLDNSKNYRGSLLSIKQEKVNDLGSWYLLYNGNKKIGWINEDGITDLYYPVTATINNQYSGQIVKPWSINTLPWGTAGAKKVVSDGVLVGSQVNVLQEKKTDRATYALVEIEGNIIGWIDNSAIEKSDEIISDNAKSYNAIVRKPWSINSRPWGTKGFERVADGADFVNETVRVVREKTTSRSIYALIEYKGQTIGWIDTTGIEEYKVLTDTNVNYSATLTKPWSINTAPWGTEGAELAYSGTDYINKEVRVLREQKTLRGTYALVEHNGKKLGWIDTTGISPHSILSDKRVNYTATITQPWSVNSKPWGIKGFKTVVSDNSLVGTIVNVKKEQTTQRSTYLLLEVDGETLGWIDETGVRKNYSVFNHEVVDYAALITKPWSINTAPWGSQGYKLIMSASKLLGSEVRVRAEQVTERSTFALIEYNGKEIGWIDTTGINAHSIKSQKDVNYTVSITKAWSINSQPWGIKGFNPIQNNAVIGEVYQVTKEAETPRGKFSLLTKNGRVIGWIDSSGVTRN